MSRSPDKKAELSTRRLMRRNYTTPLRDQNQLCFYDLPGCTEPEAAAWGRLPTLEEESATLYPDWTEENTFTVVGPVVREGVATKKRGKPFPSVRAAKAYYVKLYGKPVEEMAWEVHKGEVPPALWEAESTITYGFRFRKRASDRTPEGEK